MKRPRAKLLAAAVVTMLTAEGCVLSETSSTPIETAGAAVERDTAAVEAVDWWGELSALNARRLMDEYGAPDEVGPDSLAWNDKGPWRRTVVRNVRPSAEEGRDLGIVEQTVGYSLTPAQAAGIAAFDARLAFNPRSQELTARSDREELNVLRLNLADDVAHGRALPAQARESYFKVLALEASGKISPDLLGLRLTP